MFLLVQQVVKPLFRLCCIDILNEKRNGKKTTFISAKTELKNDFLSLMHYRRGE